MNHSINNVAIRAMAACVPMNEIDNKQVQGFHSEEITKIIESTGVKKRSVAKEACASDLCFIAAKNLLANTNCDPKEIDILIFVSQTPDYKLPATACVLQHKLGLSNKVAAFDINLGCSGYTYGLIVLAQLLSSGGFKKGLLLVGDTVTKLVSEQDRSVAFLFGDAGAASLLEFDETAAPIFFDYGTDGAGYDKLIVEAGGSRVPLDNAACHRALYKDGSSRSKSELFMSGADVFSFTLKEVPKTIKQVLNAVGWDKDIVDYYIFHQANSFMLNHLVKKMDLNINKVLFSLEIYGNTSVSSIPLTICYNLGQKAAPYSGKILMAGFGVGFSWATVACSLDNTLILPVEYMQE